MHEVHVSEAMNVYLLGVRIHWGENKSNRAKFYTMYRALSKTYGS